MPGRAILVKDVREHLGCGSILVTRYVYRYYVYLRPRHWGAEANQTDITKTDVIIRST